MRKMVLVLMVILVQWREWARQGSAEIRADCWSSGQPGGDAGVP